MKRLLIFTLFIIIICLSFYFGTLYKTDTNESPYGTYATSLETLSFNKDHTYQYEYPFTEGTYKEVYNHIYLIESGDLKDHLLIYEDEKFKLVGLNNDSDIKEFKYITYTISELGELDE